MRHLQAALQQGAVALGLAPSDGQLELLLDYLALLQKWGRVYNLTGLHDPRDMLSRHLLDCLAVVPSLRRHMSQTGGSAALRLLDVGSGAGLPGVVFSILFPDLMVSCVDTVLKKVAFQRQVATSLKLPRLRGLHNGVQDLADEFDVVTSRAFASLVDFTNLSCNALAPGGVWMAMKGRRPDAEIAALPAHVQVFHVEPIEVPGLDEQRCLVWMRRQGGA